MIKSLTAHSVLASNLKPGVAYRKQGIVRNKCIAHRHTMRLFYTWSETELPPYRHETCQLWRHSISDSRVRPIGARRILLLAALPQCVPLCTRLVLVIYPRQHRCARLWVSTHAIDRARATKALWLPSTVSMLKSYFSHNRDVISVRLEKYQRGARFCALRLTADSSQRTENGFRFLMDLVHWFLSHQRYPNFGRSVFKPSNSAVLNARTCDTAI